MVSPATIIKQEDHISVLGTFLDERRGAETEMPSSSSNSDVYEETDECDLEYSGQPVWLVKLPQFIRDRWEDTLSDLEEEVELGTIMINKNDPSILKIVLSNTQNVNEGLPRVYDLKHSSRLEVDNTFVFTEKNTRKRKRKRNEQDGFPEIPARLLFKRDGDKDTKASKWDEAKGEEKPLFSRKADQNPTAVVGTIIAEMQMQPVPSAEYNGFERKTQIAAKKQSKKGTNISYEFIKDNMLNPGTTGAVANKEFLKITPSDNARVKKVDKAYRASKEIVQSKLFKLFETYEYYSTKVLVEKLCQPEAYLKEVLEDIATYNVRGDFSGKWCLKSEYKQSMAKSEICGVASK